MKHSSQWQCSRKEVGQIFEEAASFFKLTSKDARLLLYPKDLPVEKAMEMQKEWVRRVESLREHLAKVGALDEGDYKDFQLPDTDKVFSVELLTRVKEIDAKLRQAFSGQKVPSIEEVKRLFADLPKLPKVKYAWGIYAPDKDQFALWMYPHLLTGEAEIEGLNTSRWKLVCTNKKVEPGEPLPDIIMIWHLHHPEHRGFFAFCVLDHIKEITSKLQEQAVEVMSRMPEGIWRGHLH